MSWTPPDCIVALPDDGCGAPATGQLWQREGDADAWELENGAAYLLATPERLAAGEMREALEEASSRLNLALVFTGGREELTDIKNLIRGSLREIDAALAKAKETDDEA